jgi:hypothetical protein
LKERHASDAACRPESSVVGSVAADGVEAKAPTETMKAVAAIIPIFVTALSIFAGRPLLGRSGPSPDS